MIVDIKAPNYNELALKNYFLTRGHDISPFYAISDRYELSDISSVDVYRGDCYSNTVTIRLNRNFTDPEVPLSTTIIKPNTWKDNYKGYDSSDTKYEKMNRGDINAVQLGL